MRSIYDTHWPIYKSILSDLLAANRSPVKQSNFHKCMFAANCYPAKNASAMWTSNLFLRNKEITMKILRTHHIHKVSDCIDSEKETVLVRITEIQLRIDKRLHVKYETKINPKVKK